MPAIHPPTTHENVALTGSAGGVLAGTYPNPIFAHPVVFNVKDYGAVGDGVVDDRTAIQAAIDAAQTAGGGMVIFPAGTYLLVSTVSSGGQTAHLIIYNDNITLQGTPGATLKTTANAHLIWASGAGKTPGGLTGWINYWAAYSTITVHDINPASLGDSKVVTVTANDAGNYSVGDWVLVRTGQTIDSTNYEPDCEVNQVTSVNAGTGDINLRWSLSKNYVQEYYISGTTGKSSTSVTANEAKLGISNLDGMIIENINIRDLNIEHLPSSSTTHYVLAGGQIVGFKLENCNILTKVGVQSMGAYRDGVISGNRVRCNGSTSMWVFSTATGTNDVVFRDNFTDSDAMAIDFHIHEGTTGCAIVNNFMRSAYLNQNVRTVSIQARAYDILVSGNFLSGGGFTSIYVGDDVKGDVTIVNNFVRNPSSNASISWAGSVENIYTSGNKTSKAEEGSGSFAGPVERLVTAVRFNGQNPTLGKLPKYSYVTAAYLHVTQAFDSNGTDNISLGYDGSTSAYFSNVDVSTTGIKTITLGSGAGYNSTERTVEAYYTAGGSQPTTGKAIVILEYIRVIAP